MNDFWGFIKMSIDMGLGFWIGAILVVASIFITLSNENKRGGKSKMPFE